MTLPITVLLADDHELSRIGVRQMLSKDSAIKVVGEAGDGGQAVQISREVRPRVVLMDVRMPTLDGVEATRRIVASGSQARILVLTTFDLDEYVLAAIRAGASGFLLKDAPADDIVRAVRVVAAGEAMIAPAASALMPSARAVLRLTTKSNTVGCSIGISPGLVPLKILSMYTAARWNESVRLAA